jgi:hypothetical protein
MALNTPFVVLSGVRVPPNRVVHTFRPTSYSGSTKSKFVVLAENGKIAEWNLKRGPWTVSINSGSANLLLVSVWDTCGVNHYYRSL